ncbi:MAG TPA: hypothetical protein VHN14_16430 [Kofleriaceae bacterium]|jgi:hypothetical protein|nr:hypothetical protein [Kofleriaceae bacterium]
MAFTVAVMRALPFIVLVLWGGCSTEPLSQRLEDACEAHVCPDDPPEYISCMPVIAPAWEPICRAPCRDFLAQTCKIQFVD